MSKLGKNLISAMKEAKKKRLVPLKTSSPVITAKLTYPVKLTKQKEGGYLVQFYDFPEGITQGEIMGKIIKYKKS